MNGLDFLIFGVWFAAIGWFARGGWENKRGRRWPKTLS